MAGGACDAGSVEVEVDAPGPPGLSTHEPIRCAGLAESIGTLMVAHSQGDASSVHVCQSSVPPEPEVDIADAGGSGLEPSVAMVATG